MQATIVFQKNWEAIHAKNPDGTRKYRYIINTGSSRSSKTHSIIQIHYLLAFEKHRRISIWRETKKDTKDTVLADFKRSLPTFEKNDLVSFNKTESIYTFPSKSTIEICGGDDELKVHGFQGDIAHFNEPYKISKETFDQIDMRTSEFIIIDWNPKSKHWIDDLSKQDNAIVIHSTFRDNPFVPEQQKLKILSYEPTDYNIEQGTANDFMWQIYGLGLKAEKPNRIFRFTKIPLSRFLELQPKVELYGIDWGKNDPWGIVHVKYYDGAIYVRQLNYHSENKWREILAKENPAELSRITGFNPDGGKQDEDGLGIVAWMADRLKLNKKLHLICDNNRPMKIAMLRRIGYEFAFPAQKPAGSILEGITILQDMPVYYTDDSPDLEQEEQMYSWKVDRYGVVLDEPEDDNNHCMDPLRYCALHLQRLGIIKMA